MAPVEGAKLVSRVILSPLAILSWTSSVVARVLSVVHFSVKVTPRSFTLYLVSRLPLTLGKEVGWLEWQTRRLLYYPANLYLNNRVDFDKTPRPAELRGKCVPSNDLNFY